MPIGGEFELSPHALPLVPRNEGGLRTHLFRQTTINCTSARGALSLIARYFSESRATPRIWLPAYICESVPTVFQFWRCDVRFYPTGLAGVRGEIFDLPDCQAGDVVLFVHYFGKLNKAALQWLETARDHLAMIIEDCVQAPFTIGCGQFGDVALNSYRKFLPVPSGASMHVRDSKLLNPLQAFLTDNDAQADAAGWAARILKGLGAAEGDFVPLLQEAEKRFEKETLHPRSMSPLVRQLLIRANVHAIAQKRRKNWIYLNNLLQNLPSFSKGLFCPVFSSLEQQEVPLGYPIRIIGVNRDVVRQRLAAQRIFCPVHWPLPHLPKNVMHTEDRRLSKEMMTLPIDQRLDERHLHRLADTLEKALR